jgi:UV radiation resistance-associated gene protein
VPYNLKSPAKRLAQSESKALQHSRSYSDLTSPGKRPPNTPKKAGTSYEKKPEVETQPGMGQLRRRSTLHWTGAGPQLRQQKLEDVAASRLADTWFSIHCKNVFEPVYISEIMDKSMNPSFRFFDLNALGPHVGRLSEMRLRLWAKNSKMEEYTMLIDIELSLSSLQFIGKDLENFHHPLPENCLLFHLTDGIYTSFTDMPVVGHGRYLDYAGPAKPGHAENTSSYDALMRLANLDECIQDALATRARLEGQISKLLQKNADCLKIVNKRSTAKEKSATVIRVVSMEKRQIRQLHKRKDELRQGFQLRRSAMKSAGEAQVASQGRLQEARKKCQEIESRIQSGADERNGQIRRICEELSLIYPVDPIKNKALHFRIHGIHLPNSAFDDTNRDEIAAALGFTSHLVHLLSLYLSTPLPYPIFPNGSTSTIEDPISVAIAQRTFPLYPTNASFKFEYGVFLLNKDIEFLMSRSGLRMLDIRHTLPNLKYLLYVLTAGKGELPARRAGGVKGLIVGRASPSLSRRGSDDSVVSGAGWASFNGKLRGQERRPEKGEAGIDAFTASAHMLPLRNSSQKEAV